MNITYEFACRDDCLDNMVPSDLRALVVERDKLLAEVERLRAALKPMTEGTHWITDADVETACAALEQKP